MIQEFLQNQWIIGIVSGLLTGLFFFLLKRKKMVVDVEPTSHFKKLAILVGNVLVFSAIAIFIGFVLVFLTAMFQETFELSRLPNL